MTAPMTATPSPATSPAIKLGLMGAGGRMGRMLIQTILNQPGAALAGGAEQPGSEALGQDLASLANRPAIGLVATDDRRAVFEAADVVIDFTHFSATDETLALAAATGTPVFLGTTGLTEATQERIRKTAEQVAICWAANTSLGVNLLALLVEQAAKALDPSFDIEVVEIHHNKKVDAPSGTALMLGEAAAKGREQKLSEVACYARDGHVGARPDGEIGFATLRGGDVAGEHTIMLVGEQERIELTHRATSRSIFAAGAVKGALWLPGQPAGLYSMRNVLGL